MRRSKFTDAQIAFVLRQAESSVSGAALPHCVEQSDR